MVTKLNAARTKASGGIKATSRERFFMLLLVLSTVQFFAAWLWPKMSFGGVQTLIGEKPLSVPFQYTLWLMVFCAMLSFLKRRGAAPFWQVLGPLVPMIIVGFVAGAFGFQPLVSVRGLMLWIVMGITVVMIGFELDSQRALRVLMYTMLGMLVGSVLLAVALPDYGAYVTPGSTMWRGLFVGKNGLGWIAALGLVIGFSLIGKGRFRLPAILIFFSLLCLVGSGSKGALVSALAALGYRYVLARLMPRVTPGFGIAVILFGTVCVAVFALLALPILLDLLGRDITLTGRTEIWKMYFDTMANQPWLGQGPGAYTQLSPITAILASRLSEYGGIATPHNIYLATFGDGGLFGLTAFLGVMIYCTLVMPSRKPTMIWLLHGTIGFVMLVDGMVETHEVFGPGPGWFLLMLTRAIALHMEAPARQAKPAVLVKPYAVPGKYA